MKNIAMLYKTEDGLYCQQITKKGKQYIDEKTKDEVYWDKGGTITLDELDEILDREV